MLKAHGGGEGYARELVVIDISDAFMSLGLHKDELPHALAPNVSNDDFYMFSAMLFGFKTAPLVWSRVAALLARMLQSLVNGSEAQHQDFARDPQRAQQRVGHDPDDDGSIGLQGRVEQR